MPLINVGSGLSPLKLDLMSFVIDWNQADPLQFQCTLRSFQHSVSTSFSDVATLCNPGGEAPGKVVEELQLEMLWSHGSNGPWNKLRPLVNTVHTFAALPKGTGATSAANPEMSGSVWIPPVPFMQATEVNGYSIVPLTFKIFGIPVYDTDGTPVYAGHTVPA